MVLTKTRWESWQPQLSADQALVRSELEAILRDPHFANSKRYPAFLRFVTERTLEGGAAEIKERTIGVEVFGRSSDYDTNNDTVVRYTAGEVRKRLAVYYHDHDDAAIQISIPQGSYVPEFFHRSEEDISNGAPAAAEAPAVLVAAPLQQSPPQALPLKLAEGSRSSSNRWIAIAVGLLCLLLGGLIYWRLARTGTDTAIRRFWQPVLRQQGTPLLVSGGVVFSPNPYSGTETAVRTDEYPFVSMQTAAALARVSGLLQQNGSQYQMQPANATTLSDLRDRSVVLIGGYNNDWTKRLVQGTRFRLGPVNAPSILDSDHPGRLWQRDHTLPYAASDDYALIGRFHDATTGSLVVVIAGMGRNGTEAGAQFLTDSHYMDLLEQRMGHPIGDRNLEVVLKINVVEGRTGAPAIEDLTTW